LEFFTFLGYKLLVVLLDSWIQSLFGLLDTAVRVNKKGLVPSHLAVGPVPHRLLQLWWHVGLNNLAPGGGLYLDCDAPSLCNDVERTVHHTVGAVVVERKYTGCAIYCL
jgi:hypothetical protein